jgi:hypothetical protein
MLPASSSHTIRQLLDPRIHQPAGYSDSIATDPAREEDRRPPLCPVYLLVLAATKLFNPLADITAFSTDLTLLSSPSEF